MSILWLMTLAWADPTSLRAAQTEGLFRDSLDFVVQPAHLAWQDRHDLWISGSYGGGYDASAAGVFSVDRGMVAASVGWSRAGAGERALPAFVSDEAELDADVERAFSSQDTVTVDLAWARERSLDRSFGLGGFAVVGRTRSALDWVPLGSAGVADADESGHLMATSARAGVRAGFAHREGDRRWLDLHGTLGWYRDVTVVSVDEVGVRAEGYAMTPWTTGRPTNREGGFVGLRLDTERPTSERLSARVLLDASADLGATAVDTFEEEADELGFRSGQWSQDRDLTGRLTLRALGHARWSDLDLWFGGDVAAMAQDFHGVHTFVAERDAGGGDAGEEAFQDTMGVITLAVPVALEAAVHPRVVLRAAARFGWRLTAAEVREGSPADWPGTATRHVTDASFGAGSVGVRWDAVRRLSLDLGTTLRSSELSLTTPQFSVAGSLILHL